MSRAVPVVAAAVLLSVLPFGAPSENPPAFVSTPEHTATTRLPRADSVSQPQPMVAAQEAHAAPAPSLPQNLSIPSIKLSSPIVALGVDDKGNMDVPSGKTNNVGWYQGGSIPGTAGAAVLDAHVFAAFKNLHNLKIGDDIFVTDDHGTQLHFRVTAMETYKLADVPLGMLFRSGGEPGLNLINCTGPFVPSADTYSHRLIVYATLVH